MNNQELAIEMFNEGYIRGEADAIKKAKDIVENWLMHEGGKCLECGTNLLADIEKLKEQ